MRTLLIPSFAILLCTSCHDTPSACEGVDADGESPTSPQILGMSLLEDAVPGDPWELVFVVEFRDVDGDLGLGKAEVYLNSGSKPTELELYELFRQSALAYTTRSGQFTMPLRFSNVPDGAKVRMAVVVADKYQHRSNCHEVELGFDVSSVGANTTSENIRRGLAVSSWGEHGG